MKLILIEMEMNGMYLKKFDGQLWFYVKEGKNSKIVNSLMKVKSLQKLKDILNELDKNFKASQKSLS
jgi:hypothetical protein